MLDRALAILGIAYLALVYAFIFVPLVLVVLISFSADSYLTFPPSGWSLRWYAELLGNREFVDAALNSLIIAVAVTVLKTGSSVACDVTVPLVVAVPSGSSTHCSNCAPAGEAARKAAARRVLKTFVARCCAMDSSFRISTAIGHPTARYTRSYRDRGATAIC